MPGRRDDAFLDGDKSPTRRLGGIDNRGSHFYPCLFWAEALAAQTEDAPWLKSSRRWRKPSTEESNIVEELIAVQGQAVELGGYYRSNAAKCESVMRPSATFNAALAQWS